MSSALIALANQVLCPNYGPRDLVVRRARGCRIWDEDEREYLDLGSGISVCSLGHADEQLADVLRTQAECLWHCSNLYLNEPAVHLAAELVDSCCTDRAFLCNSGAEANEAAIKLARRHASLHHGPDKREILSFSGSFHGRTLATVTATAQPLYHAGFEPLPPGFRYAPFNDFAATEAAISRERTCAVIVEPVQGEGGIHPAAEGFLAHLRQLCDQTGALLIFDEIQCGLSRTGHLWAHGAAGVDADMLTTAKALANGLPIGALLVREAVALDLTPGTHGTTFGGNPLACEVARHVLRRLRSETLQAEVRQNGQYLREGLEALGQRFELFAEVRGAGLMLGAELLPNHAGQAATLRQHCREHGLLVLQAGANVMRFLPPLTIRPDDIALSLERLEGAIRDYLGAAT